MTSSYNTSKYRNSRIVKGDLLVKYEMDEKVSWC